MNSIYSAVYRKEMCKVSSCIDRAGIALYRMVRNMYNKGIELPRITKCSTQLLMAGFSSNSIPNDILCKCLNSQNNDGGWVSVADTIWNTKFLSFYREDTAIAKAISYLNNNRVAEFRLQELHFIYCLSWQMKNHLIG